MGYIQLTKGYVTLVDDDILDELNTYLWYASGLEGRPEAEIALTTALMEAGIENHPHT